MTNESQQSNEAGPSLEFGDVFSPDSNEETAIIERSRAGDVFLGTLAISASEQKSPNSNEEPPGNPIPLNSGIYLKS